MKKTTTTVLRFALCLGLLGGLSSVTMAQRELDEPGQMRVKITERSGKDTRTIERTYRSDGMTDEKRDALVNRLIDSLRAARKGKGDSNISVIIEDSYRGPAASGSRTSRRNRVVEDRFLDGDALAMAPMPPMPPAAPNVVIAPMAPGDSDFDLHFRYDSDDDTARNGRRTREFRFQRRQLDSLSRNMRRLGRDMDITLRRQLAPMADRMNRAFQNRDWQREFARPFNVWVDGGGQPSTVRGLDVYPNNPDRNLLNVRFNAPKKGDVQVVVTNTKGKEVARRELKDFSGEFVGQVDIGRKAEGVFFVTVTQNDDGAVRRVVLKNEEIIK
ncbi:T9SS type A sorting domain-containing protein [Fibrella sp. WM1]|uniref:T9SS type A sorting domain-containing protein n=1 Tax=Fibrella musci TaxID=3242485 RepID=UPI003521CE68